MAFETTKITFVVGIQSERTNFASKWEYGIILI